MAAIHGSSAVKVFSSEGLRRVCRVREVRERAERVRMSAYEQIMVITSSGMARLVGLMVAVCGRMVIVFVVLRLIANYNGDWCSPGGRHG